MKISYMKKATLPDDQWDEVIENGFAVFDDREYIIAEDDGEALLGSTDTIDDAEYAVLYGNEDDYPLLFWREVNAEAKKRGAVCLTDDTGCAVYRLPKSRFEVAEFLGDVYMLMERHEK